MWCSTLRRYSDRARALRVRQGGAGTSWPAVVATVGGVYLLAALAAALASEINEQAMGEGPRRYRLAADRRLDALLGAVCDGDAAAVRRHLAGRCAAGGRVNWADDLGCTPLVHAARLRRAHSDEVVLALLEGGADVNGSERLGGITPLAEAVRSREEGDVVAELLLGAGGDPRATDAGGRTPLHWAAARGDADGARYVRVLLAAGADPRAADADGGTPLDWATEAGDPAAADLLRAAARHDRAGPGRADGPLARAP